MANNEVKELVERVFGSLDKQIPTYSNSEWDWKNCQGNVAACIIEEDGTIHGKIWGDDKLKGRRYYEIAYRKASQVWITGYPTNEYERMVFSDQLNYKDFGIELPDLIGWLGGQPLQIEEGTRLYCGFSGFRGVTDVAIVKKAFEEAKRR